MKKKIVKFLNCKIDVSKKVFIPRIETEYWIGKAIKQIKKKNLKNLDILDIFSGTGCIGIAVLKNYPKLCKNLDFIDISKNAISEIKINIDLNKIPKNRCRAYTSSFFEIPKVYNRKYDIIFANPPYIAKKRIFQVQKKVLKTEPKTALFSGKDGMNHIKRFLRQVKNYLKPNGIFFLEFDPLQKKSIENILKKQGFKFKFYKDQFKKWRWLRAGIKKF